MRWWMFLILFLPETALGRPRCGGTYTATRGVLQTPGFPHKFPVPVHCEWVIEAQHASGNSSIIVYLTQLYVFEGMTFKEYQIYDKTYQLNGKEIHAVSENNISKVSYVQTYQDYLVITLRLDVIESTHLRVLDHFLDVYGFNITYEISVNPPREDRCTMTSCGFTGICYDYYTRFGCECFPGYLGSRCSEGPNSLCTTHGSPACKNGGTCTHVGDSAVKCDCAEGFTGETCDAKEEITVAYDCEDCLITCPAEEKNQSRPCKCSASKNKLNSEIIGYFVTFQFTKPPGIREEQVRRYVENQLSKALKENATPMQDSKIVQYEPFPSGAEVTFRFYSARKEEKKIKAVLSKWKDRGHIGNISLAHKDISFTTDPFISLQSVNINQAGVIREGGDFILSCVARGSPNVSFRWFKDGVFINVSTATSYKWTRLIEDPNIKDQYTALLGIDKASALDQGLFTCQVVDQSIQQCLSKQVEVRSPPKVWIEPMSLTVRKGENFTIKCFSALGTRQKIKYAYSWTKNKELLPIKTDTEHYEILYPMGSILQVASINKSTTFSCLVQDELVSSEMSISVNVVQRNLILTCPGEAHLNVLWPETAPGTENLQECPREYVGVARRSCSLRDARQPTWQMPDYSDCTPVSLLQVDSNFQRLKLGYKEGSPSETLTNYLKYLDERPRTLLPGEGARILTLVLDVITFMDSLKYAEIEDVLDIVFRIVDCILLQPFSVMNEGQVVLLQQVVRRQARLVKPRLLFHRSFTTIDVTLAPADKTPQAIRIPDPANSYPRWYYYKLHLSLGENYSTTANKSATLAVVVYRNLSAFLPPRSVIRLKDGVEIEYEIVTNVVAAWVFSEGGNGRQTLLTMEFIHPPKNSSFELWNQNCGVADFANFGYSWDLHSCRTRSLEATTTRCTCNRTGTFAVLFTKKQENESNEEDLTYKYIILLGCITCLSLSGLSGLILLTYWILQRSCLGFLKVQCCASVIGAMIAFMYAVWSELPDKSYLYVTSFLETFLLTAMSSQLSKLLIVYTEIVQLPRMGSIKQTIVLIITGAPLIAVFGNHLAHRSMNTQVSSWWLMAGSLSFNIFVTCFTVLVLLFCIIYQIVIRKIAAINSKYDKGSEFLRNRLRLLHRSAYVFYLTVLMIFCSIAYVNLPEMLLCHYLFSSSCALLGFATLLCYIIYAEVSLRGQIVAGWKGTKKGRKKDEKRDSQENNGNPLKFFTKEKPDIDNESTPNYQPYFCKNGKAESRFMPETICKYKVSEISSPTFKTYASATFPEHKSSPPECLERYSTSPKQFTSVSPSSQADRKRFHSPDILASEKFVELDLVASSLQKTPLTFGVPETSEEIICTPSVSKIKQQTSTPIVTVTHHDEIRSVDDERLQPEGQERAGRVNETSSAGELIVEATGSPSNLAGDKLDEMMDKITHDLDYLLNRDNEFDDIQPGLPVNLSIRKISKSQVCVFEQIEEESEEDVKVPEAITNVSRTNC